MKQKLADLHPQRSRRSKPFMNVQVYLARDIKVKSMSKSMNMGTLALQLIHAPLSQSFIINKSADVT